MWIFVISFLLLIAAIVSFAVSSSLKEQEEEKKNIIRKKNEQAVSNWLQQRVKRFNEWRDSVYNKYGKADVCLQIRQNEPDWTILVWQNDKFFYFNNRIIKFADILGVDAQDNQRVVVGQTTATTKTDVWSEIKRDSMVRSFGKTTGTFLAGPLKQTTEIKKAPDKIYHSYIITLTINDFNKPTLEIKTGEDKALTDKVLGLINIMMAQK